MNFWGTALDRRQAEECFEERAMLAHQLHLAYACIVDALLRIEDPVFRNKHLEIILDMEKEYHV